jgi:hypothetical protein
MDYNTAQPHIWPYKHHHAFSSPTAVIGTLYLTSAVWDMAILLLRVLNLPTRNVMAVLTPLSALTKRYTSESNYCQKEICDFSVSYTLNDAFTTRIHDVKWESRFLSLLGGSYTITQAVGSTKHVDMNSGFTMLERNTPQVKRVSVKLLLF